MLTTQPGKIITAIQTRRWSFTCTILLLAIFLIFIHLRLHDYAFDDAFIHFRIARNLFETGKPYFNINEPVKVSTSTGWIVFLRILLSLLHLFKFEYALPMLVGIFNALATLGGLLIYGKIISRLSRVQLSFTTTSLFCTVYIALVIRSSIGLMETPFALLIVGLGVYCLLLSKPVGFFLLAVAVYFRLEFAIVLILATILSMENIGLKNIVVFSVFGLAPFLIYDLYSFHTFTPQSIIAKSIVYLTTWQETTGNILFFSLPTIVDPRNHNFLVGTGILFLIVLYLAHQNAFKEAKSHGNFWPLFFCTWGTLIMAGYIFGHAFMFDWYFPLYTVPILVGFILSIDSVEYPSSLFIKGTLSLLVLISMISISQTYLASIYNRKVFSLYQGGSRVKTYQKLGETLYEKYPNATLLSPEIGALGYSFRGKILDPLGLASPEALNFQTMKESGTIPPEYVRKKMPEIIISYDIFAQSLLHSKVIEQYQTVQIPAYLSDDPLYSQDKMKFGGEYLRVYIRKDLPVPSLED